MKSSTKKFLVLLAIVLVSIYILLRVDSSLNIDRNCLRVATLQVNAGLNLLASGQATATLEILDSEERAGIHIYSMAAVIEWADGTFDYEENRMTCRISDGKVYIN